MTSLRLPSGLSRTNTPITTADHDDRVVPAHSFKFAATLQEMHRGPAPVLIRIETESGHGASGTAKRLGVAADTYAFLFRNLGVAPKFRIVGEIPKNALPEETKSRKGAHMNPYTEETIIRVKNFPSRPFAEAGKAFLQKHHIEAILQGSDIAGTGMPQGFDLYVQSKDAETARRLLERLYDGV